MDDVQLLDAPPSPPNQNTQEATEAAAEAPAAAPASAKKPPKAKAATGNTRSVVWNHFTKIKDENGKVMTVCNYCPKTYNAESNRYDQTCLNFLKGRFKLRGVGICDGEYLHIRCTTHILNLIVGEGMKVLNQSIDRVREVVKYVRQTPSRWARFKIICGEEGIESKSWLSLDVVTRWNSTYLMLKAAEKFQKALETFVIADSTFFRDTKEGAPTEEDWNVVREVMELLEAFYKATIRVSGSTYVTSNTVFREIDVIGKVLRKWTRNPNPQIKAMCVPMQTKYDKYWGCFQRLSKLYWVGVVVDPRFKLAFFEFYLRKKYWDYEAPKYIMDIRTAIDSLYGHYEALHQSKNSQNMDEPASKRVKMIDADVDIDV